MKIDGRPKYWTAERYVRFLENSMSGGLIADAEWVVKRAVGALTHEEYEESVTRARRHRVVQEIRDSIARARRLAALGHEEESS